MATSMHASKHTPVCVECSPASVGLTQALPSSSFFVVVVCLFIPGSPPSSFVYWGAGESLRWGKKIHVATFSKVCTMYKGQVEMLKHGNWSTETEVRKLKYGNGSMEMEVWKWKEKKAAHECLVPYWPLPCNQRMTNTGKRAWLHLQNSRRCCLSSLCLE